MAARGKEPRARKQIKLRRRHYIPGNDPPSNVPIPTMPARVFYRGQQYEVRAYALADVHRSKRLPGKMYHSSQITCERADTVNTSAIECTIDYMFERHRHACVWWLHICGITNFSGGVIDYLYHWRAQLDRSRVDTQHGTAAAAGIFLQQCGINNMILLV